MDAKLDRIWTRTRALQPIIEAHRGEGDSLGRLPDEIAEAFVSANVYRLLLPEEFGGEGIDPITYYDLVEEVSSSYDGSVGWNYSIGTTAAIMIGDLSVELLKSIFAGPDCYVAGAATPPGRGHRGGRRLSTDGSLDLGERDPSGEMGVRQLPRFRR